MSDENVEMARRAFDAYNRGDVDAAVADIAPECEYVATGAVPDASLAYHKPEGFKQFIAWLRAEFDDVRLDVNDLIDAGDRVVISFTAHGRGKASGAATSWNLWHVWTIRDAKFVRGRGYTREAEALEAAGLSE